MMIHFQIQQAGKPIANFAQSFLLAGAAIMGATGGIVFPRAGHFLGYAFLVFINVSLSLTIGRNFWEQMLLFAIFSFIELVFFLSRRAVR